MKYHEHGKLSDHFENIKVIFIFLSRKLKDIAFSHPSISQSLLLMKVKYMA
jgi:hypothetical protein